MNEQLERLPAPLREAMLARGYDSLTPVQEAVVNPELAERDLRISSQTGSGKTVAVGLALADVLEAPSEEGPLALVIAPTRELAAQVTGELSWLFERAGIRVLSVTGGTSVLAERKALARGADVIVGTPGRLLDHVTRGAIDPSSIRAVVLDEADQLLDLGFREELEAILSATPGDRRTHLVSATFPREVLALAQRYQKDAVRVAGTPPGDPNADIVHVAHIVHESERADALVNVLLLAQGEQTLVFSRTRAGAAELADRLLSEGFAAAALTGEMDQRERTRTLDAFRAGALAVLVATDVAARGIDVPEVTRVVHFDVPDNAETYTHRSGRTGRAGRKGTSVLLAAPSRARQAAEIVRRAKGNLSWLPVPGPDELAEAASARLGRRVREGKAPEDPRWRELAAKLLEELEAEEAVARLLSLAGASGPCPPRRVTPLEPPRPAARGPRKGEARSDADFGEAVTFRVGWGSRDGADPRRLLALVCRRGGIRGADVGAIRVGPTSSTVEVLPAVAERFAAAVQTRDVRDGHVNISRARPSPSGPGQGAWGDEPSRGPAPRRAFDDSAPPPRPRRAPPGEGEAPRPRSYGAPTREAPRPRKSFVPRDRGDDRPERPHAPRRGAEDSPRPFQGSPRAAPDGPPRPSRTPAPDAPRPKARPRVVEPTSPRRPPRRP